MANLFKAMGQMLRDCTVSGQPNSTGKERDDSISTENPAFWSGVVYPYHETNAYFQLLMTITLTKTASGSPYRYFLIVFYLLCGMI